MAVRKVQSESPTGPKKVRAKPATAAKTVASKEAKSAKKAAPETTESPRPVAPEKGKPAKKTPPPTAKASKQAPSEASAGKKRPAPKSAKTPTAPPAAEAVAVAEAPASEVPLAPGYDPSPDEEYMNPRQLAYFRRKLLDWRDALLRESQQTIDHLRSDGASRYVGDEADRARDESEVALELRTRDRYRKLLPKIDAALRRIEDGSYGFCEETGEPIGLKRLEARPIATLSVEAQELREKSQRGYRDDA